MVASLVGGVLFSRLVVATYGLSVFAAISLISAIPAMIPFADLGLGASVVNGASDVQSSRDHGSEAISRLKAALVLLFLAAFALLGVGVLSWTIGAWAWVFGPVRLNAGGFDAAASIALAVVGLGVVASFGSRVLQGWSMVTWNYLISGLGPLISLSVVWVYSQTSLPAAAIGIIPVTSALLASIILWLFVQRTRPGFLKQVVQARVEGRHLRSVAKLGGSALITTIGTAVAFQSDRVVLGHVASSDGLAGYSLVAPLFMAAYGLLNAVGQLLWPKYRQLLSIRVEPDVFERTLLKDLMLTATLGVVGGLAIALLGPYLVGFMLDGTPLVVSQGVYYCFGLLLLVQAILLPAAMLLTDSYGFRVQKYYVLVMASANLVLTVLLASWLGPVGAVIASVASVGLFQLPLTWRRALLRVRSLR
jgi:O-antigen/teichoic acid export membrane protein